MPERHFEFFFVFELTFLVAFVWLLQFVKECLVVLSWNIRKNPTKNSEKYAKP